MSRQRGIAQERSADTSRTPLTPITGKAAGEKSVRTWKRTRIEQPRLRRRNG